MDKLYGMWIVFQKKHFFIRQMKELNQILLLDDLQSTELKKKNKNKQKTEKPSLKKTKTKTEYRVQS